MWKLDLLFQQATNATVSSPSPGVYYNLYIITTITDKEYLLCVCVGVKIWCASILQ